MTTMKALRFHGAKDLRLDSIPVPELKAGQVKMRPAWCGICGTGMLLFIICFLLIHNLDLHEYAAGANLCPKTAHPITGEKVPLTLGHEFSGIVEEVGSNVTKFKSGDRVVLEPIIFDGTCNACKVGHYNCCSSNGFVGISGYGGGFSEQFVIDENYLNHLPDGIPLQVGGK
jgi:threonine dehydrogenase-like Zn-dependent dehydrogenase